MAADLPLKLLLITVAGLVNRDQSRLIGDLLEHNNEPPNATLVIVDERRGGLLRS